MSALYAVPLSCMLYIIITVTKPHSLILHSHQLNEGITAYRINKNRKWNFRTVFKNIYVISVSGVSISIVC